MAKTVLYIHFFPDLGGSATSLYTLVKYLDWNRFSPHVLQMHPVAGDVVPFFRSLNVDVDHLPDHLVWDRPWYSENAIRGMSWRAFRANDSLRAYMEKLKPDIVHINDFPPISAGITAGQMNVPVVWHSRHVFSRTRPFMDPGQKIMETMVRESKRIVAISESEAKQFNSSKVKVIYNPIEFSEFDRVRGTGRLVRQELGIQEEEFVVIAPIALSTDKGAWDFIKACGLACKLVPQVHLKFLITGSIPTPGHRHRLRRLTGFLGPASPLDYARRLARQAGIENSLLLTGFRKDIYQVMDAADLVVFPSHLKACGRACFEAGALGKPIIVTMPDKNTRVVLDGVTGLILPDKRPEVLADAIGRLASHPDEGKQMGRRGLDYTRQMFDAPVHAANMMELYDEILDAQEA